MTAARSGRRCRALAGVLCPETIGSGNVGAGWQSCGVGFEWVLRRDEVRQLVLSSEIPTPISDTFDLRDLTCERI